MKNHKAVNWNETYDHYTQMFWQQNIMQFWVDEEIPVSLDKNTWVTLTDEERSTYKKVLAGLTLLDTSQGGEGMPLIGLHTDNLQQKALMSFMGAMEQIHAKSYSTIFTTIASKEEIDWLFDWCSTEPHLQKKAEIISALYRDLLQPSIDKKTYYKALVGSVCLESFLFYSGFFYPLFLAGQGKMTNSGEIINLIIRDESIHGLFIGLIAQDTFKQFTAEEQEELRSWSTELFETLMENERSYTASLYTTIGLTEDVYDFLHYNANKALMNVGLEPIFPDQPIHPIVENGLRTETKTHDFFSQKGNGYVKSLNVEPLQDEDFDFPWLNK
ncbi:MAG: class 1b ribonucleoside-diphosphate reductase subunit beta [Bacilli bacterium]